VEADPTSGQTDENCGDSTFINEAVTMWGRPPTASGRAELARVSLAAFPILNLAKIYLTPLSVTIHNSDWTSRLRSFAPPDGRGRLSLHELCYAQPRICAPLQFSG
jgi:hypothetical protein